MPYQRWHECPGDPGGPTCSGHSNFKRREAMIEDRHIWISFHPARPGSNRSGPDRSRIIHVNMMIQFWLPEFCEFPFSNWIRIDSFVFPNRSGTAGIAVR